MQGIPEKVVHNGDILDDFPASYRVEDVELRIARSEDLFFNQELDLKRLHRVIRWLWLCGQTMPPRPLHAQLLLGRRVVITERLDLHLIWGNDRMFLKPLPRWLLHQQFWEQHRDDTIRLQALSHGSLRTLRSSALGFLLSYIALIQHESDFFIAKDAHIIPDELTWKKWKVLVREILQVPSEQLRLQVADRFIYGELRLRRLNLVYRCLGLSFYGYFSRWNSYSNFVRDNMDLVVAGTVYLALILSAMQVGLSTTTLEGSKAFQAASYGATVLAILGPLGAVTLILVIAVVDFLQNWAWNRRNEKKTEIRLGRTWKIRHVSE
ncbi:hypothetical protein M406DRAFT_346445 [Cryphonectria parasitica EP155]|uniref:Uncharacterized protein n=1 Tax=Cryphonectria parasitica (strain ATCC 38755 / EP155) TaxID=660469 RepID=A0A9P5CNQ3_CRYP1|nr:uncharacterized protein M406DRAFT_346445 [Cryphonectria parasitica EP155]KAF3764165.1 hypothetical protein M406DRAFT_346445 [Cryphonectria parasitica EP155]